MLEVLKNSFLFFLRLQIFQASYIEIYHLGILAYV